MVAELIAARADLTVKRTDRTIQDCDATAVFLAAKRGHTDTVRLLLEHRCSVNDATVDGEGPLFAAAAANHPDTVQVLLDARADLQQSTNYQEPGRAMLFFNRSSSKGKLQHGQLLWMDKILHCFWVFTGDSNQPPGFLNAVKWIWISQPSVVF